MKADISDPLQGTREKPMPLGHCLAQWARNYGDRIVLINETGECLTYTQLHERVERIAGGLYASGLRAGDHAMVHMPNTFGFFYSFFALLRVGVIPVMAMPNQREQDIDALMALAQPTAYFIPDDVGEHDYLALAQRMQAKYESLRLVVMDGDVENETRNVQILTALRGSACPWPEQDERDTAVLLLSGGTTGTPKLIPRTHGDYFYNFTASASLCGFDREMVFLAVLPAAHNFTLASPGVLGTFQCGGTVVTSVSASCDETMPLIEKYKVTHVALVPPLAKLWVEGREWEDSDLSSLKLIQVGGARLEAGLARQLVDVIGCKLQQVFGMAEGLLCYTRLNDPLDTIIHTQGRPLSPEDEVRIVDEDDHDVPEGQVGQLLTRGPYTIRGYFRAPVQNASSFTEDGFYRSGDLVRRDANGNLTVEGRIKEQINRCGEKISAAEIEEAISLLHGVHAAAAVGVPDELLGERICVFIKPEGGQTIDPLHIKAALREGGLSEYKVPDQIETISEWPLTAAKKVDKRRLVAVALQRASASPEAKPSSYLQESAATDATPFELAVKVAEVIRHDTSNYVLYEHHGEWTLGLECAMRITVEVDGTVRRSDGKSWRSASVSESIEQAMSDIPFVDWRAYGRADFEFAYLTYGLDNPYSSGPLLTIVIPKSEIRIRLGTVQLRTLDSAEMPRLVAIVQTAEKRGLPRVDSPIALDVRSTGGMPYRDIVASAVQEMQQGRYQKVILSRAVEIPSTVDMVASYYAGRKSNTPARSFLMKDGEFQAYGFSPEIVVTVDAERNVTTQPLAGTRALTGAPEKDQQLRKELESDVKEIAEHAVSVKLAVQEMLQACRAESVVVDEFMTVQERGSVQHLASHVRGVLAPGASAWTAFEKLFPAVTASGIPKREALESINRHEGRARGLYSGCVLIADSDGSLDAALVLRSAYRGAGRAWLQAGAGLVPHSTPEREWEETCEKLTSVGPYLISSEEH
ncbi:MULTISPECIES: salicylate synthase [Pseudomonadota]|uniref:salicylate synthase n=1 Tax=Pseudomonadota TaxID=1224 RepID=UPI0003FD2740|nr:salicylate synthase [Achromobacter xylosoxidans]HBO0525605.1 salicylate synthase [Pseudomonas aeruginosa]QKQ55936.1 salicylate synthase [Achromobacter xylosoxidans]QPR94908.1 salicylate synthase [Achromobacter xylosoxidans]UON38849.1 salicylate synthase [Achromobacter xylosoxidans]CKG97995.1 2%2C3-dihydroxybenzoate-AMP ligase [Achromobacter xylosoxidans]